MKRDPSCADPAGSRFSGVLFDFFGTLVEIDVDVPRFHKHLSSLGYRCSLELESRWNSEAFNGCETPSGSEYREWRLANLRRLCLEAGVPDGIAGRLACELMELDMRWTVRALPDARRLLTRLAEAHVPHGICSNWDYPLEPYLEQAGLPTPPVVTTSWEVGARKPHPRVFLSAASELGVHPERTLFVGDDIACDVDGALAAGMTPCLVGVSAGAKTGVLTVERLVQAWNLVASEDL